MFISDLFPNDIISEHGLADPSQRKVTLSDLSHIPLKAKPLLSRLAKFHQVDLDYDPKTKSWMAANSDGVTPFIKDALHMAAPRDTMASRMQEDSEESETRRDDDLVQQELAKHDINVERIVPAVKHKHFPRKSKLYIQGDDQKVAYQVLRQMGYGDKYEVVSALESYPSIKKEAFGEPVGPHINEAGIDEAFADRSAGHSPEDSVAKKHRVSVTVVDPYIQNKDTSESQIEKFVRVTAKDRIEAENRAKQYYKKKGFRVIDAHYVSPIFEEAVTEASAGFMMAYDDDQAREHFLDYLFDHTGDGHLVNDTRNNFVRYSYPMKNKQAAIQMAVKAGIIQDDAEDAYNAIAFEYDGKWD